MRYCIFKTTCFRAGLAVTATLLTASALPIVVRHDKSDKLYVDFAKNFPAACLTGGGGSGVLAAPQWVLTAGHVARGAVPGQTKIVFGDKEYVVEAAYAHPRNRPQEGSYDVGLFKLAKPVAGIGPMPILTVAPSNNAEVAIVGAGHTGTGNTGYGNDTSPRKLRAATNRLQLPTGSGTENTVRIQFRKPPQCSDYEGIGAPGDSGGPMLTKVNGQWHIVGVGHTGYDTNGNGKEGDYGDQSVYATIAPHMEWVESTMQGKTPALTPRSGQLLIAASEGERKIAEEYVKAMNGSDQQAEEFNKKYMSDPAPSERRTAGRQRIKNDMGKLTLVKVGKSAEGRIVLQVETEKRGKFNFELEMDKAGKILQVMARPGR